MHQFSMIFTTKLPRDCFCNPPLPSILSIIKCIVNFNFGEMKSEIIEKELAATDLAHRFSTIRTRPLQL